MAKQQKRLGELLVEWGAVSPKDVARALEHAKKQQLRIGEALIELKLVNEAAVYKALASQHNMEYVDLDKSSIPPTLLNAIPDDLMRRYVILPLGKEGGRLKVVVHDPFDLEMLDILRFRLHADIRTVLAPKNRIKQVIDELFQTTAANTIDKTVDRTIDKLRASLDKTMDKSVDRSIDKSVDLAGIGEEGASDPTQAPIIKLVQAMIAEAVRTRASDVHVEPMKDRVQIRYRIDGECAVRIGIQNLGFEEEDNKAFQKIIKRPNGIFLVTGPTGSGKTTTLYGALNELNRPDRKIITAEDPVEYNFTGINQCQVREAIGLSFSKILRAMLRQAPNIILVGEIRDMEVAEVAIQAALTGHLVFSTLHTNDAPGAITRLIDMGVKPFLVASSIQAVMAQRLIRVLCVKCKQPDHEPDPMWLKLLGITPGMMKDKQIYKPRGCDHCTGTGFRGRIGIFEMMFMNNELRTLAFERAPTNKIRKAALAGGMKSLLADGRLKVLNGTTTAEEIVKVAQVEGVVT